MSCVEKTRTAFAVCKAITSRILFLFHGLICIWRVTVTKGAPLYWCLLGPFPVMVFETYYSISRKKGGEWKWVCPSVMLYLTTVVPAIWFLELDLMTSRAREAAPPSMLPNVSQETDDISVVFTGKPGLPMNLKRQEWCKVLEQVLLLLLIVGRWLMPKGDITREQLSQLLLVYIGMAADIIELFEAFKEKGVRENSTVTIIILALWTASLMQFSFVLTATKSKRRRPVLVHSGETTTSGSGTVPEESTLCPTEVLAIVISITLQDGPFLVLRLLLIFRYNVLSYTNLFFTSKNSLVLVLQFYRLIVLFSRRRHRGSFHPEPTDRHHHRRRHHGEKSSRKSSPKRGKGKSLVRESQEGFKTYRVKTLEEVVVGLRSKDEKGVGRNGVRVDHSDDDWDDPVRAKDLDARSGEGAAATPGKLKIPALFRQEEETHGGQKYAAVPTSSPTMSRPCLKKAHSTPSTHRLAGASSPKRPKPTTDRRKDRRGAKQEGGKLQAMEERTVEKSWRVERSSLKTTAIPPGLTRRTESDLAYRVCQRCHQLQHPRP